MISSNSAVARISSIGAELKEFTCNGKSFLWNGDPNYWAKTSPVLFPIVGALRNGLYLHNGKSYQLPRHGFAREMEFEVFSLSESEVSYRLIDSQVTRNVYPFSFQLEIRYKIFDNGLKCEYMVFNSGEDDLLFSLGAHPAFKISTDYSLKFVEDEALERFGLENGLMQATPTMMHLTNHTLKLNKSLFYNDALILKSLKSKSIELLNEVNSRTLTFEFENFPYFGVWSAKDADFVCLEPWAGISDKVNFAGEFKEKEGIVSLLPGKSWSAWWKITV
jgi:galactose mutarotase-like enzyme